MEKGQTYTYGKTGIFQWWRGLSALKLSVFICIELNREVELPYTAVQGGRIYCIQIYKEEGLSYVAEQESKVH